MIKIWNELTKGYIFEKFDKFEISYQKLITFKKDNELILAHEDDKENHHVNSKYDEERDIYYTEFNPSSSYRVLVSYDNSDLKDDYIYLKELNVNYNGDSVRYALPVNIDVYVLNNQGDTIQKI